MHVREYVVLGCLMAANALDSQPSRMAQQQCYERLASRIVAPCCWRQTINNHYSQEAQQVAREIRAMLADGLTEDQTEQRLVAKYGVRILAEPPGLTGLIVNVVPVAALLGGAALVCAYVRRQRASITTPMPDREIDPVDFSFCEAAETGSDLNES
jgi:cytochrome c-type biogenesis protein CcmH/NrfF